MAPRIFSPNVELAATSDHPARAMLGKLVVEPSYHLKCGRAMMAEPLTALTAARQTQCGYTLSLWQNVEAWSTHLEVMERVPKFQRPDHLRHL